MVQSTKYQDLDPGTVRTLVESGRAVLIDVRERHEHDAEHIEGAQLFPLSSFDPNALPCVDGVELILQCGSGKRSATAMDQCRVAGIGCRGHLAGGIMAWKAAGLPTSR